MEPTQLEAIWDLGRIRITSRSGGEGVTIRTASSPQHLTDAEIDQVLDALIDARDFHTRTATTTTAKD